MSMNIEKLRHHFWPSMMAIIFSTLGWLGMPERPVIYADAIPGVKIVEGIFTMPRGLVAAMFAMLFSPGLFTIWRGLPNLFDRSQN